MDPTLTEQINTATATGNWTPVVVSVLITAVMTLGGYFLWRKRGENTTEDTIYNTANDTIKRQQEEIREKDARIKELLLEGAQLHTSRNDADARAVRAETHLEIAQESKERMEIAMTAVRKDIDEMKLQRQRDAAYIVRLQQALIAANLPVPPEPEFD